MQLEAKDVLAAWFLGEQAENKELARDMAKLKRKYAKLERKQKSLELDLIGAHQMRAIAEDARDEAVDSTLLSFLYQIPSRIRSYWIFRLK